MCLFTSRKHKVTCVTPGRFQPSVAPCSVQTARQPDGSTCTFIRRRQDGQNRGGSSALAARQPAWSATPNSPPQRSQ